MLDFDTARQAYLQIRQTKSVDLRDLLIDTAINYARLRVDWLRAEPNRQPMIGADRTACHNSLIGLCDALALDMQRVGEDASLRTVLGTDRKVIGDFACFVYCFLALSAR